MHWFSPPVIVKAAHGHMLEVKSVEACIEQMQKWPVRPKLKAAYPICYGALADPPTSTIDQARKAFIAAAKEARAWRGG